MGTGFCFHRKKEYGKYYKCRNYCYKMADIRVSIKEVRNDNYMLPLLISRLDNCQRSVAVMKWRVPADMQDSEKIKEELIAVQHEMENIQEKMEALYRATKECMDQYEETENTLFARAKDFE